jgi:hypothetical protein
VLTISTEKGTFAIIAEQIEDMSEFVGDVRRITLLLFPVGMAGSAQGVFQSPPARWLLNPVHGAALLSLARTVKLQPIMAVKKQEKIGRR